MDIAKALKALSEPHLRDEKMVTIIERSAQLAGISYSRCYEIWYRRARCIEPAESVRITEALDRKRQRDARNELRELQVRIAQARAIFHSDGRDVSQLGSFGAWGSSARV